MSQAKLMLVRRAQSGLQALSDDALVAACAIGDTAALGTLFDRHHRTLYGFLSRLAGTDARDLDDFVQATFLEVMRAAGRYRRDASVRSWLFGIAANVVSHHVRSEVRRRAFHVRLSEQPLPSPLRPDEAVERDLMLSALGRALAELPHRLRVVYVMCELEEMPGVEVARALGLRQGTLWRLLYEARVALRAHLEGRQR